MSVNYKTIKKIMKKLFFTLLGASTILLSAQIAKVTNYENKENIVQNQNPEVISTTSVSETSNFLQTVGFEGQWTFEMDVNNNKITLKGGTIVNKDDSASEKIRMMVYLADQPFDLNNPQLIGEVYSYIDIDGLNANDKKTGEVYSTLWANSNKPESGKKYYPYILIGEQNPETNEFEVRDIKVFQNPIEVS